MQALPKHVILQHPPDILTRIRQEYNLEKPGRMEEAVTILRQWVNMQQHFKKKDFSDHFLESTIIACKGSLERAKAQLDKMCTLRTLLPQFFGPFIPKSDFALMFEVITISVLPKLTPDNYRVCVTTVNENAYKLTSYLDYFRYIIMLAEYLKAHDYYNGLIVIADFTKAKFGDFVSNISPVQIKQALTILIEGYGVRLRGVHFFTDSKLVDAFINLLRQFVSAKIASRIQSHTKLDDIANIIPNMDMLPKEYGGQEKTAAEFSNAWIDIISSKEFNDYMVEMSSAATDETCRPIDKFNEQYAGVAGTFRHLSVD